MSTADSAFLFQGIERKGACGAADSALRIVLLPGEVLRVPRTHGTLRILSGSAWVSLEGRDIFLCRGDFLDVARRSDPPIVSGLGRDPLLFEVC